MKETAKKAAAGLCVLVCAALAVSLPLAGCEVGRVEPHHTVSYDRGNIEDGVTVSGWPGNEKVPDGSTATVPAEAPSAEGWTFDNWYTTAEATVTYSFSTIIEKDTTIYAHWTKDREEGPEPEPEPGPAPEPLPDEKPGEDAPGADETPSQDPSDGTVSPAEDTPDNPDAPADGTEDGTDKPGDSTEDGTEDGTEDPVVPASREADIILFAGQSNMAGRGDFGSYSGITTSVQEGHGYAYDILSQSLGEIKEPFGYDQNATGNGYMNESAKSGSMVSAFVESYYAETGRPVVAVSASQGGAPVAAWTKGGTECLVSGQHVFCNYYRDTLERLTGAVQCVEQEETLSLHGVYMVWLQGESDGALGTSADTYIESLDSLYMNLTQDLEAYAGHALDHMYIIPIGTYEGDSTATAAGYTDIRNAQIRFCSSRPYADCISLGMQDLTSSGTGKYLKDDNFHVHLTQPGYELLGRDAGSNMGRLVQGQTPVLQRYNSSLDEWYVPLAQITPITEDVPSGGTDTDITPPDGSNEDGAAGDTPDISVPDEGTDGSLPGDGAEDTTPGTDEGAGDNPDGSVPDETPDTPDGSVSGGDEGAETQPGDNEGTEDIPEESTPGEGTDVPPADNNGEEGVLPPEDNADEGTDTVPGADETVPGEGTEEQPGTGAGNGPEPGEDVPAEDPNSVHIQVDTAGNMISLDSWEGEVQTLGDTLVLPDSYDLLTDRHLLGWYYTLDDGATYVKVTATTKVEQGMTIVPYFANEFYNMTINNKDSSATHVQDAGPSWGVLGSNNGYNAKFDTSQELNTNDYSEDLTISWTGTGAISDGVWFRLLTHYTLGSGNIPHDYFNVFYELTNHGSEDLAVTIFFCTSGYPGLASTTGDTDNILASAVAVIPAGQTVQVILPHMYYTSEHNYANFPTAIMIGDYDQYGNRLSSDVHTYDDFELGFELGMYFSNTLSFASMQGGAVADAYLAASGSLVSFSSADGILTVCKGNTILLPDASYITAPEGYAFEGWYLDADCTKPAGASVSVYEDTTVYARWSPLQTEEEE